MNSLNIALDPARSGLTALAFFMLPTILVIWSLPWFVTQDGPSHLYNAYLTSELLKGYSPAQVFYTLNWMPLPNLAGHWLLVALMQVLSARNADRVLMTLTSVGLASSVVWLRWQVAGWKGMAFITPLAVLLALNVMWLKGFYSFLLGACLFAITLGYWWTSRQRMGLKHAVILTGFLVLGYFCHLVTVFLTLFGLVLLCLMTPGPGYRTRCCWTALSLTPIIPLGLLYSRLMQAAGEVQLTWTSVPQILWSLRGWFRYVGAGDPFAIPVPFLEWKGAWALQLLRPTLWVASGLLLLVLGTMFSRSDQTRLFLRTYRGWIILACCLIVGWLAAPSHLGAEHGGFLRMRFLPLALIAIAPILKPDPRRVHVWVGLAALSVAVIIQSAAVWDVALATNKSAPVFIDAVPAVGAGKQIGVLRIDMPFRGNVYPLLHMDNMLGIGTGNIVWHNYEAVMYYFPVQYRHPVDRDLAREFDELHLIQTTAPDIESKIDRWNRLLAEHHQRIDVLLVWGTHPRFDEINRQWYSPEPIFQQGNLRALPRR